jgi:arylsulfatase A
MSLSRRRFVSSLMASSVAAPLVAQAPQRRPNIVIIYCDDLGYGDLSCYGGRAHTPNLDRMAKEGARFTEWNSASPVCSPSRAALLTGRYPTRVRIPRVLGPLDNQGLPESEKTLAEILKPLGYRTQIVGKWHLGHNVQHLPTKRGFDHYFGIPYSNDMSPKTSPSPGQKNSPPLPLIRDEKVEETEPDQRLLTRRYTEEALRFLDQTGTDPFFLYLPHSMPHSPIFASDRFRGKSPLGLYGDVLAEIDWSVGEVLGALKKKGVDQNTLVLFSSDNGPWFEGSPGRLRGRKGMTWEGGVRVPFIARMPGKIPAGKVHNSFGSMLDVVPTVTSLVGVKPPNAPDGVDQMPVLTGAKKEVERDPVLYFDTWHLQCVRKKNFKLHVARWNVDFYNQGDRINFRLATPELYNLELDPDESYDCSKDHPEIAKELAAYVEKAIPTFPEEVQKAWAESKRNTWENRPGASPKFVPSGA